MLNQQIGDALRQRKSRTSFGYGLSTAEPYVKSILQSVGEGICRDEFNMPNAQQALKYAAGVLTYCHPGMRVDDVKATSNFGAILPSDVQVPEHTALVFKHVLTTTKEDRDNDVLETKGATLDPKAPLLWQHLHTLPIGSVLATTEHTDEKLAVASAILDINDLTADAVKLVEAGVLRISHGFRALEFEERKADEGEVVPGGFRVTKFEIMEASLVSVPSNTDAEIEVFSSSKFKSDAFKTYAKSYMSEVKESSSTQVAIPSNVPQQLSLKLGATEVTVSPLYTDVKDAEGAMPFEPESNDGIELEKAGRSLSAANVNILKDVRDDLEELGNMELPRAANALCKRCGSSVDRVLKSAMRDEEQEEDDKSFGKSMEMVDVVEEKSIEAMELSFTEAASFCLRTATVEELHALRSNISSLLMVRKLDQKAEEYRTFVG